jgi:hypothetical protein
MDNGIYGLSTPPGATGSAAFGMYPYGSVTRIVGIYVENGYQKPIYWSYGGSGVSTYTTLDIPTSYQHAHAYSVNDYGQIVGYAWSQLGGEIACQWYYTSSAVTTLGTGDPSWQLRRAHKINSYSVGGKVVGYSLHSGQARGFVYSPY